MSPERPNIDVFGYKFPDAARYRRRPAGVVRPKEPFFGGWYFSVAGGIGPADGGAERGRRAALFRESGRRLPPRRVDRQGGRKSRLPRRIRRMPKSAFFAKSAGVQTEPRRQRGRTLRTHAPYTKRHARLKSGPGIAGCWLASIVYSSAAEPGYVWLGYQANSAKLQIVLQKPIT